MWLRRLATEPVAPMYWSKTNSVLRIVSCPPGRTVTFPACSYVWVMLEPGAIRYGEFDGPTMRSPWVVTAGAVATLRATRWGYGGRRPLRRAR